jgi:hypothetical protein
MVQVQAALHTDHNLKTASKKTATKRIRMIPRNL